MGLGQVVGLPCLQVGALQLLGEFALAQGAIEGKGRALGDDEALQCAVLLPLRQLGALCGGAVGTVEHFCGLDAANPLGKRINAALGKQHAALG